MKRIQGALRNKDLLYFYMPTSKDIIYYTDDHDVDEDLKSIVRLGGSQSSGVSVGITKRAMSETHNEAYNSVASIGRHLRNAHYYTDFHNVDEDIAAISLYGGDAASTAEGAARRNLNDSPTSSGDGVASSNI